MTDQGGARGGAGPSGGPPEGPDALIEHDPPPGEGLSVEFLRPAATTDGNSAPAPPAVPAELVENVLPSAQGLATDEWLKFSKQEHMNETRRTLARGLLVLVGVLAVIPSLALVFSHWTHFKSDDFRELSLVFTPIVALASAAFGFFFASDERNRDP